LVKAVLTVVFTEGAADLIAALSKTAEMVGLQYRPSGVSDEQRSIARQVEHARAYSARKGWRVLDEHVYVDDGISAPSSQTALASYD
jgi:hypothetical protein